MGKPTIDTGNAPDGYAPAGDWWDRLVDKPCPDCRATVHARWSAAETSDNPGGPGNWHISIKHTPKCPTNGAAGA